MSQEGQLGQKENGDDFDDLLFKFQENTRRFDALFTKSKNSADKLNPWVRQRDSRFFEIQIGDHRPFDAFLYQHYFILIDDQTLQLNVTDQLPLTKHNVPEQVLQTYLQYTQGKVNSFEKQRAYVQFCRSLPAKIQLTDEVETFQFLFGSEEQDGHFVQLDLSQQDLKNALNRPRIQSLNTKLTLEDFEEIVFLLLQHPTKRYYSGQLLSKLMSYLGVRKALQLNVRETYLRCPTLIHWSVLKEFQLKDVDQNLENRLFLTDPVTLLFHFRGAKALLLDRRMWDATPFLEGLNPPLLMQDAFTVFADDLLFDPLLSWEGCLFPREDLSHLLALQEQLLQEILENKVNPEGLYAKLFPAEEEGGLFLAEEFFCTLPQTFFNPDLRVGQGILSATFLRRLIRYSDDLTFHLLIPCDVLLPKSESAEPSQFNLLQKTGYDQIVKKDTLINLFQLRQVLLTPFFNLGIEVQKDSPLTILFPAQVLQSNLHFFPENGNSRPLPEDADIQFLPVFLPVMLTYRNDPKIWNFFQIFLLRGLGLCFLEEKESYASAIQYLTSKLIDLAEEKEERGKVRLSQKALKQTGEESGEEVKPSRKSKLGLIEKFRHMAQETEPISPKEERSKAVSAERQKKLKEQLSKKTETQEEALERRRQTLEKTAIPKEPKKPVGRPRSENPKRPRAGSKAQPSNAPVVSTRGRPKGSKTQTPTARLAQIAREREERQQKQAEEAEIRRKQRTTSTKEKRGGSGSSPPSSPGSPRGSPNLPGEKESPSPPFSPLPLPELPRSPERRPIREQIHSEPASEEEEEAGNLNPIQPPSRNLLQAFQKRKEEGIRPQMSQAELAALNPPQEEPVPKKLAGKLRELVNQPMATSERQKLPTEEEEKAFEASEGSQEEEVYPHFEEEYFGGQESPGQLPELPLPTQRSRQAPISSGSEGEATFIPQELPEKEKRTLRKLFEQVGKLVAPGKGSTPEKGRKRTPTPPTLSAPPIEEEWQKIMSPEEPPEEGISFSQEEEFQAPEGEIAEPIPEIPIPEGFMPEGQLPKLGVGEERLKAETEAQKKGREALLEGRRAAKKQREMMETGKVYEELENPAEEERTDQKPPSLTKAFQHQALVQKLGEAMANPERLPKGEYTQIGRQAAPVTPPLSSSLEGSQEAPMGEEGIGYQIYQLGGEEEGQPPFDVLIASGVVSEYLTNLRKSKTMPLSPRTPKGVLIAPNNLDTVTNYLTHLARNSPSYQQKKSKITKKLEGLEERILPATDMSQLLKSVIPREFENANVFAARQVPEHKKQLLDSFKSLFFNA